MKNKGLMMSLGGVLVLILIGMTWTMMPIDDLFKVIVSVGLIILLWFYARMVYKMKPAITLKTSDLSQIKEALFAALGGKENIVSIAHCSTRVLLEVKSSKVVNAQQIRELGIMGVLKPSDTKVQLIAKELVPDLVAILER